MGVLLREEGQGTTRTEEGGANGARRDEGEKRWRAVEIVLGAKSGESYPYPTWEHERAEGEMIRLSPHAGTVATGQFGPHLAPGAPTLVTLQRMAWMAQAEA